MKYKKDGDLIHILTIEGEIISIDTQPDGLLGTQGNEFLKTWRNADFKGVTGLTNRDLYVLKILGAINLPDTSYDPQKDANINRKLRHQFEDDMEPENMD